MKIAPLQAFWQSSHYRQAFSVIIDNMAAGAIFVLALLPFILFGVDGAACSPWLGAVLASPLPIIVLRYMFKIANNMPTPGEAMMGIHVVQATFPERRVWLEIQYSLQSWFQFLSYAVLFGVVVIGVSCALSFGNVSIFHSCIIWLVAVISFFWLFKKMAVSSFFTSFIDMQMQYEVLPRFSRSHLIASQIDHDALVVVQGELSKIVQLTLRQRIILAADRASGYLVDFLVASTPVFLIAGGLVYVLHWDLFDSEGFTMATINIYLAVLLVYGSYCAMMRDGIAGGTIGDRLIKCSLVVMGTGTGLETHRYPRVRQFFYGLFDTVYLTLMIIFGVGVSSGLAKFSDIALSPLNILIVAILSAFIGAFTLYFSDRYARRSIILNSLDRRRGPITI